MLNKNFLLFSLLLSNKFFCSNNDRDNRELKENINRVDSLNSNSTDRVVSSPKFNKKRGSKELAIDQRVENHDVRLNSLDRAVKNLFSQNVSLDKVVKGLVSQNTSIAVNLGKVGSVNKMNFKNCKNFHNEVKKGVSVFDQTVGSFAENLNDSRKEIRNINERVNIIDRKFFYISFISFVFFLFYSFYVQIIFYIKGF